MTYIGLFEEVDLNEKIKELKKLIKEKNDYIKIQDKEIDTLKGQIDLKELEIEYKINEIKLLDLFSGIGGFSLGLESTGYFETIGFVEKDEFCQKVLKKILITYQ